MANSKAQTHQANMDNNGHIDVYTFIKLLKYGCTCR